MNENELRKYSKLASEGISHVCLPLDKNPTSISLASMNMRGITKQNADTKWMNGAVGPP